MCRGIVAVVPKAASSRATRCCSIKGPRFACHWHGSEHPGGEEELGGAWRLTPSRLEAVAAQYFSSLTLSTYSWKVAGLPPMSTL